MIGIYKITSPSNKIYIGQSVDINKRFSAYRRLKCKGQRILYNSFLKHGVENHVFEVIHECKVDNLNKLERHYQEHYNAIGRKGMNCKLTKTIDKSGYCSEETKRNIRTGSQGTRIGRKHTKETKRKIGLAHIGNKHGLGRKMSKENKDILKSKNKGNKYGLGRIATEEQKRKHSDYMKNNKHCVGRPISIETRGKISKANKGLKRTPESRLRISESKKKIILNQDTGVFYFGVKDACEAYGMKLSDLTKKLNGKTRNNTSLIYTKSK